MDKFKVMKQLQIDEAVRNKPYDDATGKPLQKGTTIVGNVTIAVGRNLFAKPLKQDEINYLLNNDIDDTMQELDTHLPWWRQMSEARQEVIVNMCFNMGIGDDTKGLQSFHATMKAMQEKRYTDAAAGMRSSVWAKQVGPRAERLAKMMENG